MTNAPLRTVAVAVIATLLLAPATGRASDDADIEQAVSRLFAGRAPASSVSVVLRDAPRREFLALHLSTYLDVKELRVYVVPYRSTDTGVIDAALADDDHEAAFQALISSMRVNLGARYVSDAGLNGINSIPVPLGAGSLRDNYHRDQFPDYAAADRAYRSWLKRALALQAS